MTEQTTAADKILTIQVKSAAATNQPLTPLSQQEVSTILNQVPTTTATQIVQQFPAKTPTLPVPPPDTITPEQYIEQPNVRNEEPETSAQANVHTIPSAVPSQLTPRIDVDKGEDIIEVKLDDADKSRKSNQSHGKPIPIE